MKKLLLTLFVASFFGVNAGKTDTVIAMSSEKVAALKSLIKRNDSLIESLKSSVPEIPDSSQVTFSKVYSDVKGGIQGLAASLKVGAEHVYGILVKQQVVISVVYLVMLGISILLFVFSIRRCKKIGWSAESYYESHWRDRGGFAAWKSDQFGFINVIVIVSTIVSCILFSVGMYHLDTIVMGIINPEYGAIQDIVSFVK